jgi:hypothetical protein
MPPGPGFERLQELGTRRSLQNRLAGVWGREPEVSVEAEGAGGDPNSRITQDTLRQGRLEELMEKEPALEEAVRELDLELLE